MSGEDTEHVRLLAGLDSELPPIVVHRRTMRVVDGMHRVRAAESRGEERIAVHLFDGTEEDAFVLAVKLNSANGLPLSQADRGRAAARILASHPHWSDRRIAEVTGLAAGTVAAMRKRSTDRFDQLKKRVGRDGRARPVDPAEGRIRASESLLAHPDSPLREIAAAAGISIATAKDVRDRIHLGKDPLPARLRHAAAEAAVPQTELAVVETELPSMRKDPSMRTEAGRALIQLLSAHSIGDRNKWRRLAGSVPGHRTEAVAQAARACAEQWLRLASELEERNA
ncbi:streptomycin biosynthesis protein [Streptomyces sp. 8N616]|uniref:streptomycin biosynthesis protein n=1 Tax=Streptomyces sp. 8N616 TaxID=3457414 RepID=UPI003FD33C72